MRGGLPACGGWAFIFDPDDMRYSFDGGCYRCGHGGFAFLWRSGGLGLCGGSSDWGVIEDDDATFSLCFLGVGGRLLNLGLSLPVEFTLDNSEFAGYIGIKFKRGVNLRS